MTEMNQRIGALTSYLLRRTLFSLTGTLWVILTLAYWLVLFNPGQGTPHADYYLLVIGMFGAAANFLVALAVAARANLVEHYPFLVRLPSRVEYLASVLLASTLLAGLLQGLLALLALYNGPGLSLGLALDALPMWTAVNLLAAVLALHASDFITQNWSRVWVYGILAILLFTQNNGNLKNGWLTETLTQLGRTFAAQGLEPIGNALFTFATWLNSDILQQVSGWLGMAFWPFKAVTAATIAGYFTPAQAMAPAVLLLYATVLFMLAADLFATKDLDFLE